MSEDPSSVVEWLLPSVSILGLAVLGYLIGSFSTEFETFLYPNILDRAYEALESEEERVRAKHGFHPPASRRWIRSPDQTGVTVHDERDVQPGYTVWGASRIPAAWMVDMEGNLVHEWEMPWRRAFQGEHPHVDQVVPSYKIQLEPVHVYPDGDLLGIYSAPGVAVPRGYGLVRVGRNSRLEWSAPIHAHSDATVVEDGGIWVLTQNFRKLSRDPLRGLESEADRILEDFAVRLSPDGKVRDRISLSELVADSKWAGRLFGDWFSGPPRYPLMTRSIEIVGEPFAAAHEFAEPGQLLVSFRSAHAVALVDIEKRRLAWASAGFWKAPSEFEALSTGNMLVYDTHGYAGPGRGTRVAEFRPVTGEIVWSYHGTLASPFYAPIDGDVHRLDNGNLLFSDPREGRILELSERGEIVWQYYSPIRLDYGGTMFTPLVRGEMIRLDPDALNFEPTGAVGDEPIWKKIRTK